MAFRICPWTDLYEKSVDKYWWQIKLALATQSVSAVSGGISILVAMWSIGQWLKKKYDQDVEKRKEKKKNPKTAKAPPVAAKKKPDRRKANRTQGMEEGRA